MKFDLHIHTHHSSDSNNSVADIIRLLRSKGFQGAAFLDHNTPDGGREALSLNEKDFIVIPGIEVSSAEGHILALNVTDPIARDMGVRETIDKIHDLGGIAVAAHPYRYWSGIGENNIIDQPFDAVETFNGRSPRRSNRKVQTLAETMGIGVTGGSDSHENDTLGNAYTIVPDGCDDANKVVQAIKERRSEVGGMHRSPSHTVKYVTKSVSEWIGRGMRKM